MYKTVFLTSYNNTIYGIISRHWRIGKDGSMYYDRSETVLLPTAPAEQEAYPEGSFLRGRAQAPSEESAPIKKVSLPT
jgi:hypothetical protein